MTFINDTPPRQVEYSDVSVTFATMSSSFSNAFESENVESKFSALLKCLRKAYKIDAALNHYLFGSWFHWLDCGFSARSPNTICFDNFWSKNWMLVARDQAAKCWYYTASKLCHLKCYSIQRLILLAEGLLRKTLARSVQDKCRLMIVFVEQNFSITTNVVDLGSFESHFYPFVLNKFRKQRFFFIYKYKIHSHY